MGRIHIILLHFLASCLVSYSLKHNLVIHNDNRNIFKIETFGFFNGGKMDIKISDFSIHLSTKERQAFKRVANETINNINQTDFNRPNLINTVSSNITGLTSTSRSINDTQHRKLSLDITYNIGFILRKSKSESAAQADLEKIIERGSCILTDLNKDDILIDLSDQNVWKRYNVIHEIAEDNVGLYSLIFARCHPIGPHYVNFKLQATFYNPGPDYLSAGDTPLPYLYFVFFILFTIALVAWYWVLWRGKNAVFAIHQMMLVLLLLKCLSLFFESVRFHYISEFGVSEMWSAIYYIFAVLKGIMLFTVILLIGSGWSLMKSYLNHKEKRIIWMVLVLQVLDNIAMIVLEESAPGSQGWLTWRDLLHLIDIICCCAILLPIIWSIRHLRLAAEVDGKAQNSLLKLTLFREFYVMVVIYIYFTRIVVFLLAATIPFYLLWLGPCATEAATLIFFVVTGYKFRPALDNPYLPVSSEDMEVSEYGLDTENYLDDDIQLVQSRKYVKSKTLL